METKYTLSLLPAAVPTLGATGSSLIIRTRSELDSALGDNLPFFLAMHDEYVSLKTLASAWELPRSKTASNYGQCGLPMPLKNPLTGKGQVLPIRSVLRFLYSGKGGKHSLPKFCVSRELLVVSENIEISGSGCGSAPENPIYGLISSEDDKIQIPAGTVIAGDYAHIALMVKIDYVAECIPGCSALPANPIDGLRVLFESVGYKTDNHYSFTQRNSHLLSVLKVDDADSGGGDQDGFPINREELMAIAYKISGSEAKFINRCIYFAILATAIPWSKNALTDFINRLVVREGGKPLGKSTIYNRIYLVRSYLLIKAQSCKRPLPETIAVGNILCRLADAHIAQVWELAFDFASENARKVPSDQDCIEAANQLQEEAIQIGCGEREVNFQPESNAIDERNQRAARRKVGACFNKAIEAVGVVEPEGAVRKRMKDDGFDQAAIDLYVTCYVDQSNQIGDSGVV